MANALIDLLYFVAALLAAARALSSGMAARLRWAGIATIMLVLGFVRAAHAYVWLDDRLRAMIIASGGYGERRPLQIGLIALFILVGAIVVAAFFRRSSDADGSERIAVLLIGLLSALLVARFSSLHRLDEWFGQPVGRSLNLSKAIEIALLFALIVTIAAPAMVRQWRMGWDSNPR